MLKEIGKNIVNQNNHLTHQPLFVVYQKERKCGIDLKFDDSNPIWLHVDGDEASEKEHEELEREYNIDYIEPDDWIRTGYLDIDVFVTAFFTEAGAEKFILKA